MRFWCVQVTTHTQLYPCLTFKVSKCLCNTFRDFKLAHYLKEIPFFCPGHETFSGRCFHSWEYKDADACRGKRAVVVGIGNSGGDIAVEISRSAQKVTQQLSELIELRL